jgi:phosphomannomutase
MKLLKKGRMRVLVDTMFGTGDSHIAELLKGSGIKIDYINNEINPGFMGRAPEPNEKNLKALADGVKKGKYDLGVATDGDADRVGIVDEKGNVLSGHKVMTLLLIHLLETRKMRGGVIQTICGTGLIKRICEKYKLTHYETAVGFKYICDLMIHKDILIGGEETGGIGFKGYIPERDGFLSALLIMELMIARKQKLSAIIADINRTYGDFVYERLDFVFSESKRNMLMEGIRKSPLESVLGNKVVDIRHDDGTKFICEDGSWLLLRLSGTEPKLRIYSETSSKKRSLEYLEFGKKFAFSLM